MTIARADVPRRSFGRLSPQIAVGIFVAAIVLLIVFFQIPEKSPVHDVAAWAVVIGIGMVAPLGHLLGLILGVIALFRAGDRRDLGVFGILLNMVVVAFGLFLIVMGLSGLAPR